LEDNMPNPMSIYRSCHDAAIAAGKNQWVKLPDPVQVSLDYTTASAAPDGSVQFYEDIDRRDAALAKALGGV
jgi:murein L,D-transpeptidase YcbB/YkuD